MLLYSNMLLAYNHWGIDLVLISLPSLLPFPFPVYEGGSGSWLDFKTNKQHKKPQFVKELERHVEEGRD